MKRYLLKSIWLFLMIWVLVALNLILLGIVVAVDVLGGQAPQISIPLFTAFLILTGGAITTWRSRRNLVNPEAVVTLPRSGRTARKFPLYQKRASFHSAVVVSHRPSTINAQTSGEYEINA